MEKADLDALVTAIEQRAKDRVAPEYEADADDGLEIARALLIVLGRKFGLEFVLDVQREIVKKSDQWAHGDDPDRKADAVEIRAVAGAGYFTDLIDELAAGRPSGKA